MAFLDVFSKGLYVVCGLRWFGPRVSLAFPPFRRRVEFMLASAAQFGSGYPEGMANKIRLPSNYRGVCAVRIGDPRDACVTAQTGVRVATTLRRRSGR